MNTFKEFYSTLTEMPHSNRVNYDYELEFFNPKNNDKREKFQEFENYFKKLINFDFENSDDIISPSGRETSFVPTDFDKNKIIKDFLIDERNIMMLISYFGSLISPNIRDKKMPFENRSKNEINAYRNWINNLAKNKV